MDKKYNAIQTLKDLDLSRGTRSSIGSTSGKSTFSTQSKEDRYNEAFKNDFKSSPKKEEAGMDIRPQKLPPLKPKKLPPLELETKKPLLLKPQKLSPLEGKIMNPLTGREVSISYYKSLVKSGKISDITLSQAKTGKIDFFSPPPEPLPPPPSISFPKPEVRKEYTYKKGVLGGIEIYQDFNYMSDPADIDPDWYLLANKNTPTDPKYRKKQIKLQREELKEEGDRYGNIYDTYDDPKRLLKAKPLIDERLRRWVGRKDPDVPAKYSDGDFSDNDGWYNQKYFDSSSSSDKMKKYTDLIKTLSPKNDLTAKRPTPRPKNPDLLQVAKKKSSSPSKATTPPKKKRGRPKGALNKPKPKKKSSSSSSGGYNQSSPQYV